MAATRLSRLWWVSSFSRGLPMSTGWKNAAAVIVVSNEVGCGIIPANALARRYGDLLGEAN